MVSRRTSHIALAVASLFLGTNLAGLAHYATTRHVRCLEHHELIHVARAELDPGYLVVSRDQAAPASSRIEGGHLHCGIISLFRVRMATVTSFVAVRPADPMVAVLPRPGHGDRASVALYLVAPKNSPPA